MRDSKLIIVQIEVIYPAWVMLKFLSISMEGAHAPIEWFMKKKIIDNAIIVLTVLILNNSLYEVLLEGKGLILVEFSFFENIIHTNITKTKTRP